MNPFKTREELIKEKCSTTISDKEKAISLQASVIAGRTLEPLIIQKFEKYFQQTTIKPIDMYRFRDYPYLKINYDGVTETEHGYIPAEIKVVTAKGERHYNVRKAMFNEKEGFLPLQEDISQHNWSIETKAAYYGIPPYYYTQLQQEIMGLNAPFGHLTILKERTWEFFSFQIWRDDKMLNALIVEAYKLWQKVLAQGGGVYVQSVDRS